MAKEQDAQVPDTEERLKPPKTSPVGEGLWVPQGMWLHSPKRSFRSPEHPGVLTQHQCLPLALLVQVMVWGAR